MQYYILVRGGMKFNIEKNNIIINGKRNYRAKSWYHIKTYEYKLHGLTVRCRTPAHQYKVNNQHNQTGKNMLKKLKS